jgi:hypothetical protein
MQKQNQIIFQLSKDIPEERWETRVYVGTVPDFAGEVDDINWG